MATVEDCTAAYVALRTFLNALRERDEATATWLLYPPTVWRMGLRASQPVVQPFLDAWAIPPEDLAGLTPTTTARVIAADPAEPALIAFGMVVATPMDFLRGLAIIDGPTPARTLALIETDSGWQVWGSPDAAEWRAAEYVQVPDTPARRAVSEG